MAVSTGKKLRHKKKRSRSILGGADMPRGTRCDIEMRQTSGGRGRQKGIHTFRIRIVCARACSHLSEDADCRYSKIGFAIRLYNHVGLVIYVAKISYNIYRLDFYKFTDIHFAKHRTQSQRDVYDGTVPYEGDNSQNLKWIISH